MNLSNYTVLFQVPCVVHTCSRQRGKFAKDLVWVWFVPFGFFIQARSESGSGWEDRNPEKLFGAQYGQKDLHTDGNVPENPPSSKTSGPFPFTSNKVNPFENRASTAEGGVEYVPDKGPQPILECGALHGVFFPPLFHPPTTSFETLPVLSRRLSWHWLQHWDPRKISSTNLLIGGLVGMSMDPDSCF